MDNSDYSSPTSINQWEHASTSLLDTLQKYMALCSNLSPKSLSDTEKLCNVATKFDTVIEALFHQLPNLTSILAQARNRLVPPLRQLPEEVLSVIFENFVFESSCSEVSKFTSFEDDVRAVYRRLYSLMGVCSAWREIVISKGVFWSVIPIFDNSSTRERPPIELILQRARGGQLHLAGIVDYSCASSGFVEFLHKYGTRLNAINLSTGDYQVIKEVIEKVIETDTASSLSILAIQHAEARDGLNLMPSDNDYIFPREYPNQHSLASMMGALRAFRIQGVHFHWDTLVFSSRLVDLHIEKITLGYDSAMYPFLKALSSASNLRDLTIIDIVTFSDPNSMPRIEVLSPILFPNLQSLHVQEMFLNTIRSFFSMIADGSYQLTLCLTTTAFHTDQHDPSDVLDFDDPDVIEFVPPDVTPLCQVLEQVKVNKLVLIEGAGWWQGDALHRVLQATPSLKTLKLHHWVVDRNTWSNLTPLLNSTSLPRLESLELTGAVFLTHVGFDDIDHLLRRVVLGGIFANNHISCQHPHQMDANMLQLKPNIPNLYLVDSEYDPPEIQRGEWRLW